MKTLVWVQRKNFLRIFSWLLELGRKIAIPYKHSSDCFSFFKVKIIDTERNQVGAHTDGRFKFINNIVTVIRRWSF